MGLWRHLGRRLVLLIPVVIVATFLVFSMMRLAPGDPAAIMLGQEYTPEAADAIRVRLGLDRPILIQYGLWLRELVSGDLGRTYHTREAVLGILLDRLPFTFGLALGSVLFGIVVSIPLGTIAAIRKGTWVDSFSRVFSMLGISMPVFWFGLLVLLTFSYRLSVIPVSAEWGRDGLKMFVGGWITLGFAFSGLLTRLVRGSLLEVLKQDYIRTAASKGLPQSAILYGHALRNALLPIITVIGVEFGTLLGGAVLTETIFGIPGLGRMLVDAVNARDYPSMQGMVLFSVLSFVVINLAVDTLYAVVNPTVRYG